MKCCTRLATLLYYVVFCCMKFDGDQASSLNKCCTKQHFFCFPEYCMMLYSFGHPIQFCFTLLYTYFSRNFVLCCTKCCIRLATPLLNTIKQHATMCNKCCMMFYEMLYSFGRGFRCLHIITTICWCIMAASQKLK